METNKSDFEQQTGNQSDEVNNEQAMPGTIDSNQNENNQEDFPANGNETQSGAATNNGSLADDTDDGDDDLTQDEEQESADNGNGNDLQADQSDLDDDDDESANDADGNGGYPDAINPA
jgi:hypothetical protein